VHHGTLNGPGAGLDAAFTLGKRSDLTIKGEYP